MRVCLTPPPLARWGVRTLRALFWLHPDFAPSPPIPVPVEVWRRVRWRIWRHPVPAVPDPIAWWGRGWGRRWRRRIVVHRSSTMSDSDPQREVTRSRFGVNTSAGRNRCYWSCRGRTSWPHSDGRCDRESRNCESTRRPHSERRRYREFGHFCSLRSVPDVPADPMLQRQIQVGL